MDWMESSSEYISYYTIQEIDDSLNLYLRYNIDGKNYAARYDDINTKPPNRGISPIEGALEERFECLNIYPDVASSIKKEVDNYEDIFSKEHGLIAEGYYIYLNYLFDYNYRQDRKILSLALLLCSMDNKIGSNYNKIKHPKVQSYSAERIAEKFNSCSKEEVLDCLSEIKKQLQWSDKLTIVSVKERCAESYGLPVKVRFPSSLEESFKLIKKNYPNKF